MSTRYAVASGLKGFRSSTLRVKITRQDGPYTWVVTADLLDAGTPLVLDTAQITPEVSETALIHRAGLVAFA